MVTTDRDRERILDELERFYQGKLDGVRAKRGNTGKSAAKNLTIDEPVHLRIDPERHQIVLSWNGER